MIKVDGYELKPCPFCGGDKLGIFQIVADVPEAGYTVCCQDNDCCAEGPADLGKSGAADKWNERVEIADE